MKDFDAAKRYLSKFLGSNFNPSSAFQIARAFAFRDQSEAAIEGFEKVAMKDSDMAPNAWGEVGNLYLRLGMAEKARNYYEKLVDKSPNTLEGVYNMGAALSRLGRESDAVHWFQKAIALFERTTGPRVLPGDRANLLQAISQAYAATGAIPRAIELLNEAVAIAETIPTSLFSSLQYKNISSHDFIEESRNLLAKFISR